MRSVSFLRSDSFVLRFWIQFALMKHKLSFNRKRGTGKVGKPGRRNMKMNMTMTTMKSIVVATDLTMMTVIMKKMTTNLTINIKNVYNLYRTCIELV